ncbi:MAG: hypothetical protein WDW38_007677 [Sanguina aurantia]
MGLCLACNCHRWDTFCNHLSGEWIGQYGAYTPWEGKTEPVWRDASGKYISTILTRSLEQRQRTADDQDMLVGAQDRGCPTGQLDKIGRANSIDALRDMKIPQGDVGEDSEDVDVEALAYNADGVVVFVGGNYSAGPEFLAPQAVKMITDEAVTLEELQQQGFSAGSSEEGQPSEVDGSPSVSSSGEESEAHARASSSSSTAEQDGSEAGSSSGVAGDLDSTEEGEDDQILDEDEQAELATTKPTTSTSIVEQCLVDWGDKTRMRVKATLRVGTLDNGEVDVEILRVILFKEQWSGPPGLPPVELQPSHKLLQRPCTELPRPKPPQLQGEWSVFTTSATAIEEVDPFTLEDTTNWYYSSQEELQRWDTESGGLAEEGGALWLPGGVVLTFRMADNYTDEDVGSIAPPVSSPGGSKGKALPPARGFCLGMSCVSASGTVSGMEREYDGRGELREVRLSSAVKSVKTASRV